MNLIDAEVTRMLSGPYKEVYQNNTWWSVDIEYVDDGGHSQKKLTFGTEEKAKRVNVGYQFTH